MPALTMSFRIEGIPNAQGKVKKFNAETLKEIRAKTKERAEQTKARFKTEMAAEYTSAWATGELAASIGYTTEIKGNGIEVKFHIGQPRELTYVTAALGGHFRNFPVTPYTIRPTIRKSLLIPFPNSLARQFIRGEGGRFKGSKGGPEGNAAPGIRVKQVLWGRRTGGFSRDVISEVAQSESVLFVRDLTQAIQGVAVRVTAGG